MNVEEKLVLDKSGIFSDNFRTAYISNMYKLASEISFYRLDFSIAILTIFPLTNFGGVVLTK